MFLLVIMYDKVFLNVMVRAYMVNVKMFLILWLLLVHGKIKYLYRVRDPTGPCIYMWTWILMDHNLIIAF